jgi:ketosteroid isomerase-like protein
VTSNRARANLLTAVLEALVAGDRHRLTGVLAEDVQVWTPEVTAASRDEFIEMLDRRDGAFADVAVEVFAHDVGGEYAAAEWTVSMTHAGRIDLASGATVEATGLRVELHGVAIVEFAGDRVCSLRQYWNERALLEQLGVTAATSPPAAPSS